MTGKDRKLRRKRIILECIRTAISTLLLLAVSLLLFAWFHHARPKQRVSAGLVTATPTPNLLNTMPPEPYTHEASPSSSPVTSPESLSPIQTPVPIPWAEKFADRFSDSIISDDNRYVSSHLSVQVTSVQYGKAKSAVYYIADIYLTDILQFGTVLAKDKYGSGLRENVSAMAKRSGALLAITGDTYGNQDSGIVIRNGIVHRQEKSTFDICVLYYDGSMRTFSPESFSLEEAIADGAYQAWSFGPLLLDENGNPIPDKKLNTSRNIRRANPRAGIGYYEPGHYCFVVVDGRTDDASGLTLEQFSQLFADLGCKSAYNMDGGRSAIICFNNRVLNDPYKGGRSVSDCLIIRDDMS